MLSLFFSKKNLCCFVLAVLSAAGFILAFPGGPWPLLAWVSMVPLFVIICIGSPLQVAFFWGGYGVCFWLGSVYWIYPYLVYVIGVKPFFSGITVFLLCLVSSIPYIVVGYIGSFLKWMESFGGGLKFALLLALFVAWFPVVFPGDLSMAFYRIPMLTQLADVGGGRFIHFIIIWVNILIVQGLFKLIIRKLFCVKEILTIFIIFFIIIFYGSYRLSYYKDVEKSARIGYVQPNIGGANLGFLYGDYIRNEDLGSVLSALELTKELLESSVQPIDAVFWPETPVDIPLTQVKWLREEFYALAKKYDTSLFLIAVDKIEEGFFKERTQLMEISSKGELKKVYQKANLIPFSEYLPGENIFPAMRQFFPNAAKIESGGKANLIDIKNNIRIVPLICYDGLFPSYVKNLVLRGGNVLVTLDNDTNFGPTKASEVHFAVEFYRAIENRIPLVRVNNAGKSSIVLRSGEIVKESETQMFKPEFRVTEVGLGGEEKTIYQLGGFLILEIMFVLVFLIDLISKCLR